MSFEARSIVARGLRHHVLTWSPTRTTGPLSAPMMLLHGYADAAGTWVEVASALALNGRTVIVPDLRGFGESEWVGAGGYYHFPDYIADVDAVLNAFMIDRVVLVGHSMGGTVATMYAGARPSRVAHLALLEGVGPEPSEPSAAPDRAARWLDQLATSGGRPPVKPLASRDDALRRLVAQHPDVERATLSRFVEVLARPAPELGPGAWAWRFDPLHRTTAPFPFLHDIFFAYAARVSAPVLLVDGGETGFHPPGEAARAAAFAHSTSASLPGAGHMMHWTRPRELAALLAATAAV